MRGFFTGLGLFIGWWVLMAIVFGVVGLIFRVMFGGMPEFLHFLLWLLYVGAVLIGGSVVCSEKDYIIAKFRRVSNG